MLKRTLVILILAACGVMSLQVTEAASSNSDTHLASCCGKKKHKKRHLSASSEEGLAACKRCKGGRLIA